METGIKRVGNVLPTATRDNPNQGRVYDINGIAPTITSGGGKTPCIIVRDGGQTEDDNIYNCCQPWQKSSESV